MSDNLKYSYKFTVLVLRVLLVVAVALFALWLYKRTPRLTVLEEENEVITTPTILQDIRTTHRLVTLIVEDEEAVKREHLTGNVLKIYTATYELGVDLSTRENEWFAVSGTGGQVHITLPPITLLNKGTGVDAAHTIDIYGEARDGNELSSMRNEADRIMRKRALSDDNVSRARRNAESFIREMFGGLDFAPDSIFIRWDQQPNAPMPWETKRPSLPYTNPNAGSQSLPPVTPVTLPK